MRQNSYVYVPDAFGDIVRAGSASDFRCVAADDFVPLRRISDYSEGADGE